MKTRVVFEPWQEPEFHYQVEVWDHVCPAAGWQFVMAYSTQEKAIGIAKERLRGSVVVAEFDSCASSE